MIIRPPATAAGDAFARNLTLTFRRHATLVNNAPSHARGHRGGQLVTFRWPGQLVTRSAIGSLIGLLAGQTTQVFIRFIFLPKLQGELTGVWKNTNCVRADDNPTLFIFPQNMAVGGQITVCGFTGIALKTDLISTGHCCGGLTQVGKKLACCGVLTNYGKMPACFAGVIDSSKIVACFGGFVGVINNSKLPACFVWWYH